MNKENLIKIVDKFKGKKIGVIGDLILDRFIWGDTERISPEAPVPVVLVSKETLMPGGAGNTASNIASLGGEVFVIGLTGKDLAARQLIQELKKRGANTTGIVRTLGKPTIQKTRVIARSQHVVRIDKEDTNSVNNQIEKKLLRFVASYIKDWNALVISDYAKGLITQNLVQRIVTLARKYQKIIIGDTKPQQAPYFKNATLLTPNYKEAVEIARVEDLKKAGRAIQKQLNCQVIITQGAQGMTLFEKKKIKHFPAKAKEVFDVSGAGDTVVAALALSLASGANLEQAAIIANYAAGIVVGKLGTAVCSPEELKENLKNNE